MQRNPRFYTTEYPMLPHERAAYLKAWVVSFLHTPLDLFYVGFCLLVMGACLMQTSHVYFVGLSLATLGTWGRILWFSGSASILRAVYVLLFRKSY